MSDDLDLRVIHQRHEPDPRFVAALGERLDAIVAGSESKDASMDEAPDVEADPLRRRRGRAFWIGGTAAVAAAALFAGVLLLSDDDPGRRVETTPAGPGTTAPQVMLPPTGPNGWVAYAFRDSSNDLDIFLVREGSSPRRVSGTATDASDEMCPAFSPDGRRLLYGRMTLDADDGHEDGMELVVTDVGRDGSTSRVTTIPLEGLRIEEGPHRARSGRPTVAG